MPLAPRGLPILPVDSGTSGTIVEPELHPIGGAKPERRPCGRWGYLQTAAARALRFPATV